MSTEDKLIDPVEDEDLEDGEIDDDDDDDVVVNEPKEPPVNDRKTESRARPITETTIDLTTNDNNKSKTSEVENDDFADGLEKKMAAILKKEGIVPKIPEIVLEKRKKIKEEEALAKESSESKSSRRRKRKKAQKEKEREKDTEKKRFRPENKAIVDDDDIDEDEMLGMRGASPTRKPDQMIYSSYPPQYSSYIDSDYSKDGSYDSYDSSHDDDKQSKKKRSKKRGRWEKERDRDDKRKKNRKHESSEGSDDDRDRKHKDEPRKLELCKFYLQECCAKKDQCSYMHQDFPCKYYYLGMDCIYKDECKYNHGEPLTDEFRNVLLKHIEMAPKEILGPFKRISRDNAINLLNKTHSKLCKKFGVQDTTAHSYKQNFKQDQIKQISQQIQQKKTQIQEQNANQQPSQTKIPSLLDLQLPADFIPPKNILDVSSENDDTEIEPPKRVRKSRWCDSQGGNDNIESNITGTDLLKLTGILSNDHIQKLLSAGIKTVEEINQLTVGQLNKINLTALDVMQIQEKCQQFNSESVSGEHSLENMLSNTSQDVDMRVLPTAEPDDRKEIICLQSPDHIPSIQNIKPVEEVNPYEHLMSESIDEHDDDEEGDGLIIDDGGNYDEPKPKENEDESAAGSDIDSEGRMLPPRITTDAIETFGLLDSMKNPIKVDYSGFLNTPTHVENEKDSAIEDQDEDERRDPRLRPSSMLSSLSTLLSRYKNDVEDVSLSQKSTKKFTSQQKTAYERKSIYDFASSNTLEEKPDDLFKVSGDKDMRDMQFGLDTDLRLPFQPFMDYKPATEIDGSLNGFNQIEYKVYEVDVPPPNFKQLQSKLHEEDNPVDPRLRRMLGLSEKDSSDATSQSCGDNDNFDEAIIFQCKTPKLSHSNISDVESPPNSPPKFYSPFASTTSTSDPILKPLPSTQTSGPRLDPRCRNKPSTPSTNIPQVTTVPASTTNKNSSVPDIKTYLPSSEWYQNLSSKHKIMVNQQLALVSTELKKFHKDSTPNKIFDMSFILNNQTLQQMLTNLLIFIDDDGQIHRIEQDNDEPNNMITNMQHPPPINMNQPPPFPGFPIDHRNGPPPPQMAFPMMPPQINMRPGLLGMAPQGFNPFNQPPPPIPQNNNFQQQRPMNINNNNNNNNNQRRGNNRTNNRVRRL